MEIICTKALIHIYSLLLLTSYFSLIYAQAPDTLWTKTYGGAEDDRAYSIQQTSDSGYIATGSTRSFGAGNADVWLLKTNAGGDTIWTRTYGDTAWDYGYSVQQTTDGGYIIAGSTNSFGATDRDVYVLRTDSIGDTLWTRTYGCIAFYDDYGRSVKQCVDGGYIVTGSTYSFNNSDVWLIKIDPNGDTVWTKTFGQGSREGGMSVQQTLDNGYIIAGYTGSFVPDNIDIYLIKTKPDTLGIVQQDVSQLKCNDFGPTIISGSLLLPEGKKCKVFDITGRVVTPDKIKPGIYFVEVDGKITRKVVKVR